MGKWKPGNGMADEAVSDFHCLALAYTHTNTHTHTPTRTFIHANT